MPELPEVEVVKRSLKKKIENLTVSKVYIINNKLRYKINANSLKLILGKKLISIKRRSKYLLFNFTKMITMIVHLGMTGKFFILDKNNLRHKTSFYYDLNIKDEKHNHMIITFKNNIKLIYNDVRKFGFIKIESTEKIKKNKHLKLLGVEPLSENFNYKYFKNYLNFKKRLIKDIMMDQKFIAGLGNIYVNEILFSSGINPMKKVKLIKSSEIKKIIENTVKILKRSIKKGGSSIKNFNDTKGKSGKFQQEFNVYGRKDEKCLKFNCNGIIRKTEVSSRATFYCQSCQK